MAFLSLPVFAQNLDQMLWRYNENCTKDEDLGEQIFFYELTDMEITETQELKIDFLFRTYICRKSFWDGYHWRDEGILANQLQGTANGYQGSLDPQDQILRTQEFSPREGNRNRFNIYKNSVTIPLDDLRPSGSNPARIEVKFHLAERDEEEVFFSWSYYKLSFLLHVDENGEYSNTETVFYIVNPIQP